MDRKIISRRIADIQNNLSRLNNNICAMDSLDIQRYPENYETMSTEAALRAEDCLPAQEPSLCLHFRPEDGVPCSGRGSPWH